MIFFFPCQLQLCSEIAEVTLLFQLLQHYVCFVLTLSKYPEVQLISFQREILSSMPM